jgi:phage repressor protein C with HTH and peptisase S24 domain
MKYFADNVKFLRTKYGFDQVTLASKLGKKGGTSVANWESGKAVPPVGVLSDMAHIFDVKLDDLMEKDLTAELSIPDKIQKVTNQLEESRQHKVLTYAQTQLDEQNGKVIAFPTPEAHEYVEVYGTVSAGTGEYLTGDDYKETVNYNGPVPEHDFAVRVNGDSMEPMFENGQIIFVRESTGYDIHSGQIVIAVLNEEAYVKKIDFDGGVRLISLNSKYDPICIDENDDFSVQGVVVL